MMACFGEGFVELFASVKPFRTANGSSVELKFLTYLRISAFGHFNLGFHDRNIS